ncbi:type VII secretion protein EccE [Paractinoplanes lichenicola]|uniref:Type VII secretion protein EccE n=1 Tax=Paractinoplanes lichenicola TaxID=2802976 RepID=A0ABS1W2L5_9ACTN|nr:type VII secretion protein EccE [Actinoplanes lichenicola]MBL7260953.1 type VII secretion protein EccE [Actinoplanes lichenicola]
MTVGVTGDRDYRELSGPAKPLPKVSRRPIRRGRFLGVRAGQLVATQVAAVAVALGAVNGPIGLVAGAVLGLVILALTWLRLNRRWAFEWLGVGLRFGGRRHSAAVDTDPTALLRFLAPGARVEQAELAGDPAAVVVDGHGLTAVLELGDPTGLLTEETPDLPSPATLLPSGEAELPPVLIQLLLTGAPAPSLRAGAGTPANSYRQLTEGRLLGHSRALLAVRVLRAEGWSEEELRRSLSGLVRKLVRRLSAVPARPLGEAAALRVIAELAHDDGVGSAQETWPALRVGGLAQTTFRLRRWPDPQVETSRRLVSRLLTLPAAATTVSLTAGPQAARGPVPLDMTIRLAAPDPNALGVATQALRKLLSGEHAGAQRLDGEHLQGLFATLPLGGRPSAVPGFPADGVQPAELLEGLHLPVGASGLMLGRNRHGSPVVIRLFRPEQTRALLVGGVRAAQLVALRAMALGARVVVQTARPRAWEPFVRGAAVPGESIAVVPPGRPIEIAPGSALHPLLIVVDIGPVGADNRPGEGWQATLVVRDEFSAADVDVASRADLLILQPLRPEEATLVGGALGLGEVAQWMTRIRPDMVGVVNRRAVRWAALAHTPIETQLTGPPGR